MAISQALAMLRNRSLAGSFSSVVAEELICGLLPECQIQRLRIKQEFHSMYSLRSSRGASKSGAM